MHARALWYSERRDERLYIETEVDSDTQDTVFWFYLLSEGCTTWKKIDSVLVTRYNALLMGERPRGLTHLDSFIDLATALHVVQYANDCGKVCLPCPANPLQLACSCKGYRHIGICSHVLVLNHWLGGIDVVYSMGSLRGEKRKAGGFRSGVRPALIPEDQPSGRRQRKKKTSRLK